MQTPGKILSLVKTKRSEVQLICYDQAQDKITTIKNFGAVDFADVELPAEQEQAINE